MLTFLTLHEVNVQRCNRWHEGGVDDWSPSDWGVAMAGEAGEVCNAIKKLNRIRDSIKSINAPGREIQSTAEAIDKIGEELADTVLYCDLLASRLRINLEKEIKRKFNKVSEEYNFPERLL